MSNNNFEKISVHGGGLLGGFLKYLILPLLLSITPVVFVNLWVAEKGLSEAFRYFGVILVPFLGVGILIEVYSFFNFRLILENDGTLFVKGRIKPGGKIIKNSVNVNNTTSATIEAEMGMPFRLFENDKVISEWSTKPISKRNMRRFLVGLREINPVIKFDKYCEELLQTGETKKMNTKFLKIGLPIFLGIGAMLYIPTIEILINKIIVGQFNWYQKSLQDLFYLTLVPFSITLLIFFFIRSAKFWKSEGMQSIIKVVFAVTFIVPIVTSVFRNPSLLSDIKFLISIIAAAVFMIFVLFFFPREKTTKIIKVAIALIFLSAALILNILNYLNFFTEPLVIKNEIATIQNIQNKKGTIWVTLQLRNNESWDIETSKDRLPQIQKNLREHPINLYYTKYLKTLLKVEDSISGDIIYQR